MNGVIGMAQLLELTELTEEQREYVESLRGAGKNLLMLINDILDLSKIEAGKMRLELAEFNLERCLGDVLQLQRLTATEKGLFLNLEGSAPRSVLGDELRVKQILLNLVGNAVKFTGQGGITVSVQVREPAPGQLVLAVAVRDTGVGISAEALPQIFRFGGTGLGLTISQRLAERMGGEITVDSVQGKGSCFSVTLPFEVPSQPAAAPPEAARTPLRWDGEPLRILLVEDNPVNIKFGSSILGKLGHDVVAVANGRDCLEALEKTRFDLVLLDIQIPVLNGEQVLRELREREGECGGHQPVIALTAYSLRGDRERFIEAGFDGYLSKPLDLTELIEEMRRVTAAGEACDAKG